MTNRNKGVMSPLFAVILSSMAIFIIVTTRWIVLANKNVAGFENSLMQQTIVYHLWDELLKEDYDLMNEKIKANGESYSDIIGDKYEVLYEYGKEGTYSKTKCTSKKPGAGDKRCRDVKMSVRLIDDDDEDNAFSIKATRVSSHDNRYMLNISSDMNKVLGVHIDDDGGLVGEIDGKKTFFRAQISKSIPVPNYAKAQLITGVNQLEGTVEGLVPKSLVNSSHPWLYWRNPNATTQLSFWPNYENSYTAQTNGYILCSAADTRKKNIDFCVVIYRGGVDTIVYTYCHYDSGTIPERNLKYIALVPVAKGDRILWGSYDQYTNRPVPQIYSVWFFPFEEVVEETRPSLWD